jgi:hypothetical protein
MSDGPEQMERDENMRAAMEIELSGNDETAMENPRLSANRKWRLVSFGHDADLEVDRWWNEIGEKELAQQSAGSPSDAWGFDGQADYEFEMPSPTSFCA